MSEILVVSLMSELTRPAHRALVALLAEVTGLPLRFVDGVAWQEQQDMLDRGIAQASFLCGLPCARRPALEPLAAPVQTGERYVNRPLYYSDLLVPAAAAVREFAELRGARLAYNEPGSLSGYEILRAHLAALGETAGFFGSTVASGSHVASLHLLLNGTVDVAAIDSTVLELALRADPGLAIKLRTVTALGPHPAPPFAASRALPEQVRARLRAALTTLHQRRLGRAALAQGEIARFAPVSAADYAPLLALAQRSAEVRLAY